MKPIKLLLIAATVGAMVASPAIARPAEARKNSAGRTFSTARASANQLAHNSNRSRHYRHNNHWRHHRHRSHSRIYWGLGLGYPFGYGYPYYGYGYYSGPREVIYQAATTDRSIVIAVQRRLARAGYYRGAVDGVIGYGTRNAIRSYERAHGLRVDGHIDRRLLATMGLA